MTEEATKAPAEQIVEAMELVFPETVLRWLKITWNEVGKKLPFLLLLLLTPTSFLIPSNSHLINMYICSYSLIHRISHSIACMFVFIIYSTKLFIQTCISAYTCTHKLIYKSLKPHKYSHNLIF